MNNKFSPIAMLTAMALASLLLVGCGSSDQSEARDGVLDLRDYKFESPINLDGEWRFIWQDSMASSDPDPSDFILIDVPDAWNGYEYKDQTIPGKGYGTYLLTILLPQRISDYALDFATIGTAYNVYVNDQLISGVGIFSRGEEFALPEYKTRGLDIGEHSGQIKLRIDVSNYHHRLGGLWESVSLGLLQQIIHTREAHVASQLFLAGAIFIMGFYHLGVFSLKTRARAALYFGLFCVLIGLRTLTTGSIYLHEIWPAISWTMLVRIEYLTFYMGIPLFFLFIQEQFPDEIKLLYARIVGAISLLFILLVLFTNVEFFSASLRYFQPFSLFTMLYLIYGLSMAFIKGEEGSAMVLIGFTSIVVAFINDILYVANIVNTGHLISLGVLVFILMQALLISVRFSKAYQTIDTQRAKLERTNTAYQAEIDTRKAAEEEVLKHKNHLEELVKERTEKLEDVNKQLQELTRVDQLTGIANRRRLDEDLETEWKRMMREKRPLSVILCDIDHFKFYNDTYGHQQGDDCLEKVAVAIKSSVNRPGDLTARYGGEEFCIVLPETVTSGAKRIAELIRQNVLGLQIEHSSSKVLPFVTLSLGVATIIPEKDGEPGELLEYADQALYQAKDNGRNRVEVKRME
ncbi:MAG: diguanylate cyclase [Candidatus Marinimicrobia bacterium]|nr:diguanylate cyclase [Candidatus Neomarinimicrobiota bacterium]MCF7851367.1 diguanylate cyclase [Candidatus Neomarinimicrobiota bacterium]MCF7904201.1 diguanylate cyclase [Candidatus Neomarinimicrobiota bacterium]